MLHIDAPVVKLVVGDSPLVAEGMMDETGEISGVLVAVVVAVKEDMSASCCCGWGVTKLAVLVESTEVVRPTCVRARKASYRETMDEGGATDDEGSSGVWWMKEGGRWF